LEDDEEEILVAVEVEEEDIEVIPLFGCEDRVGKKLIDREMICVFFCVCIYIFLFHIIAQHIP
jgi:hypothetical protein